MPFSVTGNCRGMAIQAAVDRACGSIQHIITDHNLRGCLHDRCLSATVNCEDCKDRNLLGYNNWYWFFGWHKSTTIALCVNNIRRASVADIVIHEWAHSCCWEHGDGKGVPGNSGSISN
jgi:hypothetical protein